MKLCHLSFCLGFAPPVSVISPSRSAGSQAFEGRGLFCYVEIEVSLWFLLVASDQRLTTQSQSADDFVVLLDVRFLQIIEQTSAVRNHLEQASPRVIILFVRLEMLGELVNALT